MNTNVKLLGFFVILYSVLFLLAHSIGSGVEADTLLNILIAWLPVILFISGIGIMMLKKWAQYVTIIIMFYFTIDNLYSGLMKYHKGNVGYFLRDVHIFFIFPLVVIVFLLIPKVNEQFK